MPTATDTAQLHPIVRRKPVALTADAYSAFSDLEAPLHRLRELALLGAMAHAGRNLIVAEPRETEEAFAELFEQIREEADRAAALWHEAQAMVAKAPVVDLARRAAP